MEVIAIAAVTKKVVDIIGTLALEEGYRLYWLREQMEWIRREMEKIQSFLKEADSNPTGSETLTTIRRQIRELAYDIEDIIDKYFPKLASHKAKGKEYLCCLCNCCTANELALEIEAIKGRVEAICNAKTTYPTCDVGSSGHDTIWEVRKNFLYGDEEPNIVGFQDDIDELKKKLLDPNTAYDVISIIGMPGLGKTTLARKIFNIAKVELAKDSPNDLHFECSAKVYVSQKQTVEELWKDIAKQVGVNKEEMDVNHVATALSAFLSKKRYVIFLDDLWSDETWDKLSIAFPNNPKIGSRIIITSRSRRVGRHAGGKNSLHKLQHLEFKSSQKIFNELLMKGASTGETFSPSLKAVGQEILTKCHGLPLAITIVAGMLRQRKRKQHTWNYILQSLNKDDQLSKVLDLSYQDLPIYLKPCFLYFGLFPKDHEIRASEIINLWVAEKFIPLSEQTPLAEDEGEAYLGELVDRNLIQVISRRSDGRIRTCSIHSLLHSRCISLASKDNLFKTWSNITSNSCTSSRVRRFTTEGSSLSQFLSSEGQTLKIRTLFCLQGSHELSKKHLTRVLQEFKFLRVLVIECLELPLKFPKDLCNLRPLRHLKLSGYGLEKLPKGMSSLQDLRTLDVRGCPSIRLPNSIWKLKNLRNLLVHEHIHCVCRTKAPLPNLQILSLIRGDCLEPKHWENMRNLRKLGIYYPLKKDRKINVLWFTTHQAEKLENLRLEWHLDSLDKSMDFSQCNKLQKLHLRGFIESMPQFGNFPPNLTELSLVASQLEEDALENLKKLPRLKVLKLGQNSFVGAKIVCVGSQEFPSLEDLRIDELLSLNELRVEKEGMPRLKKLCYCKGLTVQIDNTRYLNIVVTLNY
ncbi:toMV susceptible protein tm-2-like [Lycium ferocissimum]|uniref:toMV susceptible protein tm-2-like n=1 Tax=Lycium ferocissimum TaxID=112874 RepID=UPI002815AAA8|nr:toMV susceptible protein tm-2-like [Lycium ferocissimum]